MMPAKKEREAASSAGGSSDGKSASMPSTRFPLPRKGRPSRRPPPRPSRARRAKANRKRRRRSAGSQSRPPRPSPRLAAAPAAAAEAHAAAPTSAQAEQREALEKLSVNLARAAMTAQGAIAEAALRQADRPAALSPDPFHVAPAMTEVMSRLVAQPDRMMRAQADLFSRYMDLWRHRPAHGRRGGRPGGRRRPRATSGSTIRTGPKIRCST